MPNNAPNNQQALQDALILLRGSLSRDELLKGFKSIIEFVKQSEEHLGNKIDNKLQLAENQLNDLNQVYQETIKKIEKDNQTSLSKLKQFVFEKVSEIFLKSTINNKLEEALAQVTGKLSELEQGLTELQLAPTVPNIAQEASKLAIQEILPQIPTLENFKANMGDSIASSLELLPEGEKLKIEAIEGLRKELDALETRIREKTGLSLFSKGVFGGAVSGGGRFVKSYDLSSSLNSVLKTFSLPSFWKIIDVKLSSVPVLRLTTDYTVDGSEKTITFTSEIDVSTSLSSGQSLIVIYSEP